MEKIMAKIKIITDSAADIAKADSAKYGIDVQGFPITVGDKSFRDGDISRVLGDLRLHKNYIQRRHSISFLTAFRNRRDWGYQ